MVCGCAGACVVWFCVACGLLLLVARGFALCWLGLLLGWWFCVVVGVWFGWIVLTGFCLPGLRITCLLGLVGVRFGVFRV